LKAGDWSKPGLKAMVSSSLEIRVLSA